MPTKHKLTEKQLAALAPHQRKIGDPGGPGRPIGSRARLSKAFLDKLAADFEEHGEGVIKIARVEKPIEYLRVVAQCLPQEFGLENQTLETFKEWTQWMLPYKSALARELDPPKIIDAQPIEPLTNEEREKRLEADRIAAGIAPPKPPHVEPINVKTMRHYTTDDGEPTDAEAG